MELLDILEEITIGYNQHDKNSQTLKKHVDEVRKVLESPDALMENRSLAFSMLEDTSSPSGGQSQIFYQGSYAISTAIKHPKYEVDADIAFYVDEFLDQRIRDRVLRKLSEKLNTDYNVELKKPCITIDFKDGYKVDVAIYSKSENPNIMLFHNSINGFENKDDSVPKKIVNSFKNYLKEDKVKRSVIRLIKHFSKQTGDNLNIDDNNKIPSISYMLLAQNEFTPSSDIPNEENLKHELEEFIGICKKYISTNHILADESLLINNTFYKIKDFDEPIKVLTEMTNQIKTKNYASLVSQNVYNKIKQRSDNNTKSGLLGTMG